MNTNINYDDFETFFNTYLETILWIIDSEDDRHLAIHEIGRDAKGILRAHALSFYSRCWYYIPYEETFKSFSDLGHDFALTQTEQGAGFWDGDWPKYGEMLTKLSECYRIELCFDDLI